MLPLILRIIDVNLNRVSEGLRVLEDISRFILEDAQSSRQLKSIRHFVSQPARKMDVPLTEFRDAEGDIGAEFDLTGSHINLVAIVHANARRVHEGIRVLEELAKLPELADVISSTELRRHRYSIYTLEKHVVSGLINQTSHNDRLEEDEIEKTKKNRKEA